jgi:tripartite-type tricarboxylate transporter receptor subunit TctC
VSRSTEFEIAEGVATRTRRTKARANREALVRKHIGFAAAFILGIIVSLGSARADDWPSRPVKLIVLSSPGGAPDIMARLITEQVSRKFGKNFYVENSVGAGGITGMRALKTSAADGYTFGLAPASAIVIAPRVFKDVPFDIDTDFAPVAFVGASPIAIAVKADSPHKTFADLLAALKAAPQSMSVATTLTNSLPHLLGVLTKLKSNADFTIVPFSSSPQGVTALLRGDVVAMVDGYPSFEGMRQDGQVRILASFDPARSDLTRGAPVVTESIPGVVATGWFAIFAPRDTPQVIIDRFKSGIDEALGKSEVTGKMLTMTVAPKPMPAPEFGKFLETEKSFWIEAIEKSGARAN